MLTPKEVAERHITAVKGGDPFLMAADYADDAILIRGNDTYTGKVEIYDYFKSVPSRLGSAKVEFTNVEIKEDTIVFDWLISNSPTNASGQDHLLIANGLIVKQEVFLQNSDF
ncbi:MAG: hypothetical protein CL431_08745 [Acidimicrobiaceae bacterium]|jgi:hypothetical protein|nr:hypothetical protein [Acidimicrobiaceae bacterium]|tara:strand:- start:93377 stop:93715 length:339 start_codon:yes stop_codon:yes gene_type:complete